MECPRNCWELIPAGSTLVWYYTPTLLSHRTGSNTSSTSVLPTRNVSLQIWRLERRVTWRVTVRPISFLFLPLCGDTGGLVRFLFQKIVLGVKSKKLHQDQDMLEPTTSPSTSIVMRTGKHWSLLSCSSITLGMSGSLQILGNLTHKNNEHLLNAIMWQVELQSYWIP